MNRRSLRVLVLAVLILTGVVVFMNSAKHSTTREDVGLLYPQLADSINDIKQIRITRTDEVTTLSRSDSGWTVIERDAFPADADKILETMLAIAEANTLEAKTADPQRHEQLGVEEPVGESGTAISIFGDEFEYSLIVGKAAQTRYRYVRKAGDDQSWLIDRNPVIPEDIGDWLQSEIADVPADRIVSVTIQHADGETISISKESEDDSNYGVADIPEGRELSYPAVANGIAAVLGGLSLDDVRSASAGGNINTTTTFVARNGLTVVAEAVVEPGEDEDLTWFTLKASGGDGDEAAVFNDVTEGWQYRLPDNKSELLVRRWEDILRAPEE